MGLVAIVDIVLVIHVEEDEAKEEWVSVRKYGRRGSGSVGRNFDGGSSPEQRMVSVRPSKLRELLAIMDSCVCDVGKSSASTLASSIYSLRVSSVSSSLVSRSSNSPASAACSHCSSLAFFSSFSFLSCSAPILRSCSSRFVSMGIGSKSSDLLAYLAQENPELILPELRCKRRGQGDSKEV